MSQSNVEQVIGVLATDECVRHRFTKDPAAALRELAERGTELTEYERRAIASLDPRELARFARAIDPRLQKADLGGGTT